MTTIVAGLDVGGTTTHIRIADGAGRVLEDIVRQTPEWDRRTDVDRGRVLAAIVTDHVQPFNATVLVAGVHGCDSEQQRRILQEPLRAMCRLSAVVNDAELLVPAAGYESGTGVVAGTGSCATSTDAMGQAFTVGGWGWALGDGGSAAAIVRDAAAAVLQACDEQRDDLLADLLLDALDLSHPHQVSRLITTEQPSLWAQAAAAVFAAEEQGSPAAAAVIDTHLRALVDLLGLVQHRGGDTSVVVAAGGVFTGQPRFFQRFADRALAATPSPRTVTLQAGPPVRGAIRLATTLASQHANACTF